ncbi:MAG: RcpC/CpaB family pilus assembly protein [Propionicimonas sp.]
MSPATSNSNDSAKKKGFLSGMKGGGGAGRTVFIGATVTGVMAVAVVAGILGKAADTGTYYVLNADVAARTPVTAEMLRPVTTSAEGVPRSAYDPIFLSEHDVFTKYSVRAGDLITASNTGALDPINKDLPAGFVVASLVASPENAVAGKVRRGDYVDVYAVDSEGRAVASTGGGGISKLVLHHMLILDVTVTPSTIAHAATDGQAGADLNPGPESAAARGGIPSLYTVACSPEDAAKIALIRDKNVFMTLSSNDAGTGSLNVQQGLPDVFAPNEVGDSGAGTEKAVKAAKANPAAVVTPRVSPEPSAP